MVPDETPMHPADEAIALGLTALIDQMTKRSGVHSLSAAEALTDAERLLALAGLCLMQQVEIAELRRRADEVAAALEPLRRANLPARVKALDAALASTVRVIGS